MVCVPNAAATGGSNRTDGGTGRGECPVDATCTFMASNPANGLISFDSVAGACVPLLLALTFDEWASPMYMLSESSGPVVSVYFVMLVTVRTALGAGSACVHAPQRVHAAHVRVDGS